MCSSAERFALTLALALGGMPAAHAFTKIGFFWLGGNVTLQLQLGEPAAPLSDGSRSWNTVAAAAAADWNQNLGRVRFATVNAPPPAASTKDDRVNNVFFSREIYGLAFNPRAAAVTLPDGVRIEAREADVIVNASLTWDSYRGPLRLGTTPANSTLDLRRVLLHEFGHVLGLAHPDTATPPQAVAAVMNSASTLESLQPDDIEGVRALYFPTGGLIIRASPASATRSLNEPVAFSVTSTATSGGPVRYAWTFMRPGGQPELLERETGGTFELGGVQPADAGNYQALVYTDSGAVLSPSATLTVRPASVSASTRLTNLSTRGFVGTGANAMICGFVIGGTTPKDVLIRAIGGATLGGFGVGGTLADPQLELFNAAGALIAQNANWNDRDGASIATAIRRVGAFALDGNSSDAALLVTLPPGGYTAKVAGADGGAGAALVEVYDADADPAAAITRKLGNLSARGQVDGAQRLIAGLVVRGPDPRTFLIRAIGPTLESFGVAGALRDPELTLHDATGALLRSNDDWDTPSGQLPALRAAAERVGAFALREIRDRSGLDSVMLVTLPPGNYTAQVAGFGNATGVALIEIYEMPN